MNLITCPKCGSKMNDSTKVCKTCGTPIDSSTPLTNDSNSLAIGGFICAIISLFLNLWGIVGILATILSCMSLVQIKSSHERGTNLAIAGLLIGIFSIIYAIVQFLKLASYI